MKPSLTPNERLIPFEDELFKISARIEAVEIETTSPNRSHELSHKTEKFAFEVNSFIDKCQVQIDNINEIRAKPIDCVPTYKTLNKLSIIRTIAVLKCKDINKKLME